MVSQDYWCVITDLVLVTKAVISPPIWKQRRDYCSIFKMLYSSEQSPFLSTHIKALTALCILNVGIQCFATTAQIIFMFVFLVFKEIQGKLFCCVYLGVKESLPTMPCPSVYSQTSYFGPEESALHFLYSFYLFYKYANYMIICCQIVNSSQIEICRLEIPG